MRTERLWRLVLCAALAHGAAAAQENPPADAAGPQAAEPEAAAADAAVATVPVRNAEAPPEPEDAREAATQLDDIVVTATKREKLARELPVTIHALHGEDLEKIGAKSLHDYIGLVPGITLQDGETGEVTQRNITIRGVGPGEGANQTVGQFIGDVPMTDPYSNFITPDLDPFDLKTVEILKGPQGTYFGASALNGAIRYVPNAPELDLWSGHGFADYLSVHEEGDAAASYGAAINAPLGRRFALRAMGVQQRAPGVIDNLQRATPDADRRDKWSARGMALWEPLERLQLNLMYLKQAAQAADVLSVDNPDERFSNNNRPGPSFLRSGFSLAALDARYDFGDWGELIGQSSYQTKGALADIDSGVPASGSRGVETLRGYHESAIDGLTHELRLVSPGGERWSWIAGAFLLDYHAEVETDLYTNGTEVLRPLTFVPVLGVAQTERGLSYAAVQTSPDARETSVYGELSRRFGERWEAILGARVYRTRLTGTISYFGAGSVVVPDFVVDQRDRGVSPKLSVVYKPWNHVLTYATVNRGYQFGGINASTSLLPFANPVSGSPPPPTYKSSSLWNREAGVRTDWFQRTLRADLTLFDLDWNEAQFHQYIDNILIDNDYIDNVGQVRSQGAETTLAWLTPLDGLSLNLAAAYTRARTAVSYVGGTGEEVPAGTEMPRTPRWMTATTLAYDQAIGAFLASAALVHTYSSRAWNNIFHEREIYDYGQLNLNLIVRRPDWIGTPALTLGVTNLTDVRGVIGRGTETGEAAPGVSVNPFTFVYNRPRALLLRLGAEF